MLMQIAIPGGDMVGSMGNQLGSIAWLLFMGFIILLFVLFLFAVFWLWRSNKIPFLRVWNFPVYHWVLRQENICLVSIDRGARVTDKNGTFIDLDRAKKRIPDIAGDQFVQWTRGACLFLLEYPTGIFTAIPPTVIRIEKTIDEKTGEEKIKVITGFAPNITANTLVGWRAIERATIERTNEENKWMQYLPVAIAAVFFMICIIGLVLYMGKLGELVDKLTGVAATFK